MVLSLSLSAFGCSTIEVRSPPAALLEHCPAPDLTEFQVNAELLIYTQGLKHALALCNADKAALRQWSASVQNNRE
jgi:hypothetical protein